MTTTEIWSEAPGVLLESPLEFMYSKEVDSNRNVNAMVRFIIYWGILIYALTRHPVVFVICGIALLLARRPSSRVTVNPVLTDDVSADSNIYCQRPSHDNPFANPTPADYGNGETKLPACPSLSVKDDVSDALKSQPITGLVHRVGGDSADLKLSQRTFYSIPSSGIPDGRDDFVNGLYGNNVARSIG